VNRGIDRALVVKVGWALPTNRLGLAIGPRPALDWWALPTLRYADGTADYRRYFVAGGTCFFTIVTYRRRVLFDNERNVQLLREAIAGVQTDAPFEINAAVILPDHMRFTWSLPPSDADYSKRIGRMRASFTKAFYANRPKPAALPES
jgi:hypothetical protein